MFSLYSEMHLQVYLFVGLSTSHISIKTLIRRDSRFPSLDKSLVELKVWHALTALSKLQFQIIY